MKNKPDFTSPDLSYFVRSFLMLEAFWNFLRNIRTNIDGDKFGEDVMFTIRMIWKHGIIIILMLIPILLLSFLPQGRDLIHNMLFDENADPINSYLRVLWFLAMVIFTSYSIWVIPRFYQNYERKKEEEQEKEKECTEPLFATSTSGNFLRILSVSPFVVYGIVLFRVDPRCETHVFLYWFMIVMAFAIILSLCLHFLYSNISVHLLIWISAAACLLLPICYPWLIDENSKNEFAFIFLGNSLLFLSGIIYVIYLKWEKLFGKNANSIEKLETLKKQGDTVYYFVFGASIIIMILFSFVTNMMYVTSVSLLTLVMGSLILWFNLLSYWYKTFEGLSQFVFFSVLVGLLIYVHYPESKPHRIFLVEKSKVNDRPSLDTFMEKWVASKGIPKVQNDTIEPIYLIAGEGGGSRAGLWYTTFIQTLDSLKGGDFSKNTFATSTVSGSSVGASLLSKWYRVSEDVNKKRVQDPIASSMARNFFTNNFTAGAVFDLFFLDFVRRFYYKPLRSGRNVRLQREENAAYISALAYNSAKFKDMLNPIPGKTGSKIKVFDQEVSNYHFLPIQNLWMQNNGELKLDIPLNFFNTTEMSTGRQFAIAPVSFSFDSYMGSSLDLISHIEEKNRDFKENYNLALGTANNLSQLFPFFSAYTHIDGVGHFMDGGGCDNSGTKTLQFIYQKLHQYLDTIKPEGTKKHPIVVIYVSNGNPDKPENENDKRDAKSQLLSLLGQSCAQPFETITTEAVFDLKRTVEKNGDRYIEASWSSFNQKKVCPKGCKDSLQVIFPTARSLTAVNIDNIIHFAKREAQEVFDKLKED